MSLNLLQLTQSALGGTVMQLVSAHFGIDEYKAKAAFDTLVPTLIGSLLKKADTPDGARALYSSIMSPKVDANIGSNLAAAFNYPTAMGNLTKNGGDQAAGLLGDKVEDVMKAAAQHTGLAADAVTSLTGVASATLFGLFKNYLQASKGGQHALISALEHQLPFIQGVLPESVWAALGLGSVEAFFGGIGAKLKSAMSAFHVDVPQLAREGLAVGDRLAKKQGLGKWWWLWILVAALAAAVFLLRFSKNPLLPAPAAIGASSTPTSPEADRKESALSLTTDKDGKATVLATVGSDTEKHAVLNELKKVEDDVFSAQVRVDAATKPAEWIARLSDLLHNFKLPNAELALKGNHVELGGAAADVTSAWLDKAKKFFGDGYNVTKFDLPAALADNKKKFEDSDNDTVSGRFQNRRIEIAEQK